jgi:hypothetical protein
MVKVDQIPHLATLTDTSHVADQLIAQPRIPGHAAIGFSLDPLPCPSGERGQTLDPDFIPDALGAPPLS